MYIYIHLYICICLYIVSDRWVEDRQFQGGARLFIEGGDVRFLGRRLSAEWRGDLERAPQA